MAKVKIAEIIRREGADDIHFFVTLDDNRWMLVGGVDELDAYKEAREKLKALGYEIDNGEGKDNRDRISKE